MIKVRIKVRINIKVKFKDVRCETMIHIKGFKRSLVKNIYLDELSTASLQSFDCQSTRRRLQTGSRKLVQINIFNQ
jgi:hypothetical protein